MAVAEPTLERERALFADGAALVIGCDEVGRGAIAGPVAVGVSAASLDEIEAERVPVGLRDSKLLSEKRRDALEPLARAWLPRSAVGLATPAEVEARGIIAALGLAASRALGELHASGVDFRGAVVLLDGSHDWLTAALPRRSVLPRVITQVKADRDCAVVAAASVLAKVHRDRLMIAAHEEAPEFGWASNKGYASAAHYAAVEVRGPHPLHRRSWLREPTLDVAVESPGA
ncbi:ribonuclease HII [uncultured Schumannella sp.]|uniref:ribonuclease HII n=1 Tax=uncultured Schumannella sp. TaxID=1195956 RepID=UPI0025E71CBE|nr:ribonuclease HII [uncultured Schumannella sp.]